MSKSVVSVYCFEGQRYYGRPGVVFAPAKVSEDMAPYRKSESKDWRKIERWLLSNGYRCLGRVGRTHEGATLREWWGLIDVFGEPQKDENGNPVPMQPNEIRQRFEAHKLSKLDPFKVKARQDAEPQKPGYSYEAVQNALDLRNHALMLSEGLSPKALGKLLADEAFQAGLDALDPETPSCFHEDIATQIVIGYGLGYMVQMYDRMDKQPTAEQVWGPEQEPESALSYISFKHGKVQYWVTDREVDPGEFAAKHGFTGKAGLRMVDPGQVFCNRPLPNWARYLVSCVVA